MEDIANIANGITLVMLLLILRWRSTITQAGLG
jgi:hypothetical protein